MDWSVTYIASQIATIIMYGLLALSYYAKDRKKVLIISFLSVVVNAIAYILLSAWSGVAMCLIAIVRNILFLVDEKKNGVKEKVDKKDIVILIILYLISIVSAIFT